VVTQDAHLFHETLAENLRYARPEATDAQLWEALAGAQIADLVRSLPEGLATVVGERGYRLSGLRGSWTGGVDRVSLLAWNRAPRRSSAGSGTAPSLNRSMC
jgi:hypothetical protein